ncbi:GntR family transcriptional regulator (plasmid) [Paracoccus versutus]|uniref:DNA-binding GntR family transcriptional regulator n=1 Tax=Paracoccus versutus TaxID=34007 RepID=A0AAQ0HLL7_PARVE|nr:GntR family transcriptional regulator [Paracoccus versutus]REG54230.1 DNA-binding GntR family transcriptional regulator [Paracoccus versutus]WEJ80377.1 GntR family transcriptional regulator [Paracoccus versutus]
MSMQPNIDFTLSTAPQVYDWLRDAILRGELPPGTRLSETEIANQVGVSRQPVREAFIRLTADGLAEVRPLRPQRGTYIRRISVSAVLSARLIREAVESDLIRMLAEQADDRLLARLDQEIEEQSVAVARNDAETFVRLDDRFHRLLAVATGQEAVWEVLEGLKSQMNRLRYITARTFDIQKLIGQHAEIVEGLRNHDPGLAEAAMRRHLRELLNDLPEISRARPELFIP